MLEDLFDAVDTPYWRLKMVMDAWCALWFWPADQVELLNGTHDEYTAPTPIGANSLADLLGQTAPDERSDEAPPVDVAPTVPVPAQSSNPAGRPIVQPMMLFALDGDQTTFDDLDWGVTQPEEPVGKTKTVTSRRPTKPQVVRRRPVIALKSLDDWLDFLEAMLGTADVPSNTLLDTYDTLDQLKEFEELLPLNMGMDTKPPEERFPWMRVVRDIADRQGFLHWELEFALVFAEHGGFDLQVGNPPWVRPRWDSDAVLAEHEPWFQLADRPSETDKDSRRRDLLRSADVQRYVLDELTNNSAMVGFLSSSQVYPLLAGTQPDLYRAFMCQVWAHTSPKGCAGLLHPDTHFAGDKEGPLREAAYRRLRIHGDFVNSGQRFFPRPVGDTAHFGIHVYGRENEIRFDHLSWLVSADALRLSRDHDGSGEVPGIRFRNREFDERPHRTRVVSVDEHVLAVWRRLLDEEDRPVTQARLLFPVSTAEAAAIEALAAYPRRLASLSPQISPGFHESGAKKAHLIDYNRADPATGAEHQPKTWDEVILKGAQLSTATPVFKRHDANSNDPYGIDLVGLPSGFIPDSEYIVATGRDAAYRQAHDRWIDHAELARLREDPEATSDARSLIAETLGIAEADVPEERIESVLVERSRRPSVDFHRLAWRRQIAPNTERALYAALVPPGPAHIDAMHTLVMPSRRVTTLVAGFWASLPLDYFLRATGRGDLRVAGARAMPAPDEDHPLADALLLRTLRLNCLTSAYKELWAELFNPRWPETEPWANEWPRLPSLNDVGPDWSLTTPLRTERARRAALVEIDALVAVWIGMDADALIAAYHGRFPVLQKYEAVTWFDDDGWKIAGNARTIGQRQTKDSWARFQEYRNDHAEPKTVLTPQGYTPPFYKAEREKEMRKAHAGFQARLEAAIARGEWNPVTRKAATP